MARQHDGFATVLPPPPRGGGEGGVGRVFDVLIPSGSGYLNLFQNRRTARSEYFENENNNNIRFKERPVPVFTSKTSKNRQVSGKNRQRPNYFV
jgi:hypothetical protein